MEQEPNIKVAQLRFCLSQNQHQLDVTICIALDRANKKPAPDSSGLGRAI